MAAPRSTRAVVLVIEDDAIVALELAAIVRSLGCELLGPASSGAEAVRLAQARAPDVIVSDVTLTDGRTGIAAVRAIRRFAQAGVVFVTGDPAKLHGEADALAATVIAKPADHRAVALAIRERLR